MTDEYRQALAELERARENYNEVNGNFESTAYFELKAAEERVMALIREFKGVNNDEMFCR